MDAPMAKLLQCARRDEHSELMRVKEEMKTASASKAPAAMGRGHRVKKRKVLEDDEPSDDNEEPKRTAPPKKKPSQFEMGRKRLMEEILEYESAVPRMEEKDTIIQDLKKEVQELKDELARLKEDKQDERRENENLRRTIKLMTNLPDMLAEMRELRSGRTASTPSSSSDDSMPPPEHDDQNCHQSRYDAAGQLDQRDLTTRLENVISRSNCHEPSKMVNDLMTGLFSREQMARSTLTIMECGEDRSAVHEVIGFPRIEVTQNVLQCVSSRCLGRSLRGTWQRSLHLTACSGGPTSSQAAPVPHTRKEYFRTGEQNPVSHTMKHEGLFYTIPRDGVKRIFPVGYSTKWERLIKPFNEAAVMVRRPAVEAIDIIRRANLDHLPVKQVFFGRRGSGKTMSLNHVIHHCHNDGWLIAHIHSANNLNLRNKHDFIDSVSHEGMYDQPTTSTEWLKQFKLRNKHFLKKLKTSEKYVWNKREATEKDQPLLVVLEQGLTRPKNATDVVGVILKELQLQSVNKEFKMLLAIKAVNGLFAEETAFRKHGGYIIPIRELALHMHFRKMLRGDWVNGSIVTTVDQQFCYKQPNEEYTPLYLLGKKGFDFLDPFVPIFVDNYTDKEFESQMAYYESKCWIQNEYVKSDEGKLYLKKLSDMNPAELDRLVAWM